MTRFQLQRAGTFRIKTAGQFHCGTKPELDIRYDLKAICTGDSLDNRGFLFDQVEVQKYFDQLKICYVSCELFTRNTARALFRLIRKQNPDCRVIELHLVLSPEPFQARLTFSWVQDEPLKKAA